MFETIKIKKLVKENFQLWIAKKLGFDRKSIKAELVHGSCKAKTNLSNKDEAIYSYSKDTSDAYRESILLNLKKAKQIVKN